MKKLLLAICLLVFTISFASELMFLPYIKVVSKINYVYVIKVKEVETKEIYTEFKDGVNKKTSTTIIINGEILESLKGEISTIPIITTYTTQPPIKFDENGNEIMHFSLIAECSGFEFTAQKDSTYIFSYITFNEESKEQEHLRMDLLEDKEMIMEILKSKKSKK